MNIKSLYNRFFISAAVELPKDQLTGLGPKVSAAIELKELESFKSNHDPRTEKEYLFFYSPFLFVILKRITIRIYGKNLKKSNEY